MINLLDRARNSNLFRAFSLSMMVAILSRLATLGMAIILARELGPIGYGAFIFALGIAKLCSQISCLGWPMLMSKFVPKYQVENEWGLLSGLIRNANVVVGGSSVTCALILYFCAKGNFLDAQVSQGVLLAVVILPALSMLTLRRSQLASQKKPAKGLFFSEFFSPTMIVVASFLFPINEVRPAFYLFAGFSYLSFLIATVATRQGWSRQIQSVPSESKLKEWMLFSLPLIAAVSGKMIMSKADIIMLAPLSSMEEVGYYGAVFRITYLLTFSQVVLMTVLSPLFSEAISQENFELLRKRFRIAIIAALLFSLPFGAVVLIFKVQIVTLLYGQEYLQGVPALIYLVCSQTAATINMPLSSLMIMSGRQKAYGAITVIALIVNLLLNWFLIPIKGAEGAAIATMTASSIIAILSLIFCWSILRSYAEMR